MNSKYTLTDGYGHKHEVEGQAAIDAAHRDVNGMFDRLDSAADNALSRSFRLGILVGASASAATIMIALIIAQYIYV